MNKKKLVVIMSCLLAIIMLLSGCEASSSQTPTDKTNEAIAQVRHNLNFGLVSNPVTLDPVKNTDQFSLSVMRQLYDTLVFKEFDGTYSPRLAERWEFSEDGKELTLYIRKGVKFHNGDELKAEDVVFTIDRAANEKATKKTMVLYKSSEAIDEYTVKITYNDAYGAALLCLNSINISVVNKRAVEEAGDENFTKNPVGTGPYKFVERKSGEKIVLERFDDYFRGPAAIKNLVFKIMPDSSTAVIALEKGELDFLSHAPLTDRENLINNEKVKWYETEIAGLNYIVFVN